MNTRVKDIDFKSAQHVLQEIENMNVKGGSPFGRSAAWAFKLALEQEDLKNADDIAERFNQLRRKMTALKPTMATIHNSCEWVFETLDQYKNEPIVELKKKICDVCERIIENSFQSVDDLAIYGAEMIHENDTILMHSYSSTLMAIFKAATAQGKHFKVICTESRPLRESRNAVKVLQTLNQDIIFISDASVYEFIPQADFIIMGADTLCADGSVANKMGSAQIAKLAQYCKVPVYFASELFKLDMRTQKGYRVELERRTKWEMIDKDDFESLENIEIINQFFDCTPASDIRGIITEYGILHPSQLLQYGKKMKESVMGI